MVCCLDAKDTSGLSWNHNRRVSITDTLKNSRIDVEYTRSSCKRGYKKAE